jgi:hypothetical protein
MRLTLVRSTVNLEDLNGGLGTINNSMEDTKSHQNIGSPDKVLAHKSPLFG